MTDRHYFPRRSYLDLVRADLWRIDSGVVRAVTWLEDGSTTLGFWGAGAVVGNTCLRSDNDLLECLTPTIATPLLAQNCAERAMLAHIQQLQELLIIRSCKRIEDKLLKLLVWLSQRFGTLQDAGMTIDIFLTHQDLAETLCTTRVTITRSLKDLERQGAICYLENRRLLVVRGASPVENGSTCLQSDPMPQQLIDNLVNFTSHGSPMPIGIAERRATNRPLSVSHR